ncbi:hypothetical protein I4U23_012418 [Adineta vaga]|nr:hypothetical protein I4U23_012418 [Adineta vaga]
MAINYLNEIISIFFDRNVNQLNDDDLSDTIKVKDNTCSRDQICRILQESPSLFQLQYARNGRVRVSVEPTIDICQDFLNGRCSFNSQRCDRLHLCRQFGHCSKKGCRFPHNFTHGQNRRIVEQSNCVNIDPFLLVRLIRFHKRFSTHSNKTANISAPVSKLLDGIPPSLQKRSTQQGFGGRNNTNVTRAARRHRSKSVTKPVNTPVFSQTFQRSRSKSVTEQSDDTGPIRTFRQGRQKSPARRCNDSVCTQAPRRGRSRSVNAVDNYMSSTTNNHQINTACSKAWISHDVDNITSKVTVNLRRSWAMIVNHPIFAIEYKNYIRSEFGCEIIIQQDTVEMSYDRSSNKLTDANASALLNDRNSKFMRRFDIRSVGLQQNSAQLNILQENSSIVAFHCSRGSNYVLAMKKSDATSMMNKLFSKHSGGNRVPSAATSSNVHETFRSVTEKPSAPPVIYIPQSLANRISTNSRPVMKDEIVTECRTLSIITPSQQALLTDKSFESYLQNYFDTIYNVRFNIEHLTNNNRSLSVQVIGRRTMINEVLKELLSLISLCRTTTFDRPTDDAWINITGVVHLIQYQCNMRNIICICEEQVMPFAILIHYIDVEHHKFGVNEELLQKLCRNILILATCIPTNYDSEWIALRTNISKHHDYSKRICLLEKQHSLILYGETAITKDFQRQFELLNENNKKKAAALANTMKLKTLEKHPNSCSHEATVTNNTSSGLTNRLQKDNQMNPTSEQIQSIVFHVDEPGFEVVVSQVWNRVVAVVDSKCSITKQIIHNQIQISLPKAKVEQFDDSISDVPSSENDSTPIEDPIIDSANSKASWWSRLFGKNRSDSQSSPSAQENTSSTPLSPISTINDEVYMTIGKSKIVACTGDLTKQAVDIIVVCSTSRFLCDQITLVAGNEVRNIYRQKSAGNELTYETTGGSLPCKRIVFRPWNPDTHCTQDVKQSIDKFITSVIIYGLQNNLTTIAFPSVGCGQLGFDPNLIAEYMVGTTYERLKDSTYSRLTISFVLLPEQKTVYNAFVNQINIKQRIKDIPTTISFVKQTVKITLTGPKISELNECQNKIKKFAQAYSHKLHLTDKDDVIDWSQDTIQKYYDYCLQRRVIPSLDIQKATLDLCGPKDAIAEADKYFLQLTNETLRNARFKVISRGAVWSVEVQSGKWEQYSYQISDKIEDAHAKTLSSIDFKNHKGERCRIDFSNMEEKYQTRIRKVCRKRIDSSLPNNWDLSGTNLKRVTLSNSSTEYKDVLTKFDTTMKGNYREIVKIERIQNERWYKQYAAHRDEFTQRHKQPDERLLFHGCNKTSAEKIINECFNRAFAGVNGIVYGCGVYFHEHAHYSSSYTRSDTSTERTMFLARVLIGKTCRGDSSMKVPPVGYDTTTDGGHIFVVYHDAGAYGEHLITYK